MEKTSRIAITANLQSAINSLSIALDKIRRSEFMSGIAAIPARPDRTSLYQIIKEIEVIKSFFTTEERKNEEDN